MLNLTSLVFRNNKTYRELPCFQPFLCRTNTTLIKTPLDTRQQSMYIYFYMYKIAFEKPHMQFRSSTTRPKSEKSLPDDLQHCQSMIESTSSTTRDSIHDKKMDLSTLWRWKCLIGRLHTHLPEFKLVDGAYVVRMSSEPIQSSSFLFGYQQRRVAESE